MTRLQGVLFDMDGTLCDSEPAWMAAEFALASRYGAEWTHADGRSLVGSDLLVSAAYIQQRMGLQKSPAQIVEELLDDVIAVVASKGVQWRPGAVELLVECNEAGVPAALVTMAYRRLADAIMAAMPAGWFDAVVTGEEVDRGKPAPDAYLRAAELLGVEPRACVAIEDSPTGADAGEAAGCLLVAVPNVVEIPRSPGRQHLPTLEGVNLDQLRTLMAQR